MAITIGICDDNPQQVGLLVQYINSHQRAGDFDIIASTDPQEFLELLAGKSPQLVFLDIDMGEMGGIRLGREIRTLYKNTVIIYITAYEKYALEAFGIRAFHYLLKPLTREKFDEVLDEGIRYAINSRDKAEKTLTIRTKKEVLCLNFDEIIYFEKTGHKIKIHTADRDFNYYGNFASLLETLGTGSFIQCHQGYVVNISKIHGFRDKTLFLEDDVALPVSRSNTENVKKILAEKLFSGKRGI